MATITISLPDSLKPFIEDRVLSEGFGSVSEYLRALVRDEQKRTAQSRLEAKLLECLQSAASELTAEDWSAIRHEVRQWQEKGLSSPE